MPAAVLIHSHGFWCGWVRDAYLMLCISHISCYASHISHCMHLTFRVCSCCGSWILTVGVGLGLRCWLLADICPWFGTMFSEFVQWFAGVTVINSSYLMSAAVLIHSHGFWCGSVRDAYLMLCISHLESAVVVARGSCQWHVARFGMLAIRWNPPILFEILMETSASGTLSWASLWENLSSGFSTRYDSNRPAQLQRLARVLKFWI